MQKGLNADDAMKKLRPPVIFKQAAAFKAQANAWDLNRLITAMTLITEAEAACKTTGNPPETLCSRALMRIAQAVKIRL